MISVSELIAANNHIARNSEKPKDRDHHTYSLFFATRSSVPPQYPVRALI